MFVILSPNTNRLRQLVRDHGEVWCNITSDSLNAFFKGERRRIISLDGSHTRNVPADICETLEVSP